MYSTHCVQKNHILPAGLWILQRQCLSLASDSLGQWPLPGIWEWGLSPYSEMENTRASRGWLSRLGSSRWSSAHTMLTMWLVLKKCLLSEWMKPSVQACLDPALEHYLLLEHKIIKAATKHGIPCTRKNIHNIERHCLAWWPTVVILAPWKLRHKDHRFPSLCNLRRPWFKICVYVSSLRD